MAAEYSLLYVATFFAWAAAASAVMATRLRLCMAVRSRRLAHSAVSGGRST